MKEKEKAINNKILIKAKTPATKISDSDYSRLTRMTLQKKKKGRNKKD